MNRGSSFGWIDGVEILLQYTFFFLLIKKKKKKLVDRVSSRILVLFSTIMHFDYLKCLCCTLNIKQWCPYFQKKSKRAKNASG